MAGRREQQMPDLVRHRRGEDHGARYAVAIGLLGGAAVEHVSRWRSERAVNRDPEHRMRRTAQITGLLVAHDQKNGSRVVAPNEVSADTVIHRDELTLRFSDDGWRGAGDVDEMKADGKGAKSGHGSIVDRPGTEYDYAAGKPAIRCANSSVDTSAGKNDLTRTPATVVIVEKNARDTSPLRSSRFTSGFSQDDPARTLRATDSKLTMNGRRPRGSKTVL